MKIGLNTLRKKELQEAIKGWQEYTDRERYPPAKYVGQCAVDSLELELRNGEPYCVCHLMKLKDCPAQSQNRNRIR